MTALVYEVVDRERPRAAGEPRLLSDLADLGFVEVGHLRPRLADAPVVGSRARDALGAAELGRCVPVLRAADGSAFVSVEEWAGGPVTLFRTLLRNGALVETVAQHAREDEEVAGVALLRPRGVPVSSPNRDRQVVRVRDVRQAWDAHQARALGNLAKHHAPVLDHREVGHAMALANAAADHEERVMTATRLVVHLTRLLPVLALLAALWITVPVFPLAWVVLTGAGTYAVTSLLSGRLAKVLPSIRRLRPDFEVTWAGAEQASG